VAPVNLTPYRGRRLLLASLLVGAVGIALWILGLLLDPVRALYGWLIAFCFGVSIAIGALIFLMCHETMGAAWPVAVRRLTEAVVGALPVLAVAFVPVAIGATTIYLWADPPAEIDAHLRELLHHKSAYLNVPFFVVRGVVFLAIWIGIASLLRRWSFATDATARAGAPRRRARQIQRRARALSAVALPIVGITVTFAAFDWLMSLQPAWFSSAFGIYYFAGGFVASLGLITILAHATRRSGAVGEAIARPHFHALGRLLFAFSIFWTYIAFFQAMLIQLANKPEEVTFYLERLDGGWKAVAAFLVIGRFVILFFVLLPRAIKFRPAAMAAMGAWIVFVHYVDIYWLIAPALREHGVLPTWHDVVALVGLGGLAVAFAAWRLQGKWLVPAGDSRFAKAIHYESPS
jgi:hypothetical protein